MAEKRKRGQNFTPDEKDKLVKLLLQHKNTILNKKTDGATNEAKNSAWTVVTEMFNSSATIHRSKESLMKAWDKMKSESKIYYSQTKRSCLQTGGGVTEVKFNPILEQVSIILGRGCSGIIGVPDSDSGPPFQEPEVLEIEEMDEQDEIKEMMPGENSCVNFGASQLQNSVENPTQSTPERQTVNGNGTLLKTTPLWSRRRPQALQNNERTEAVSTLCETYKDINKKKADIEDIKRQLLLNELEHKSKLYAIELKAAETDLKIKEEVLKQVQGTGAQLLANVYRNLSKNN